MFIKSKKQRESEEAELRKTEFEQSTKNSLIVLLFLIISILFQNLDFGSDTPSNNDQSYVNSSSRESDNYGYSADRAVGMGNAYTHMQKVNNRASIDSKINSYNYAKSFDMSSN